MKLTSIIIFILILIVPLSNANIIKKEDSPFVDRVLLFQNLNNTNYFISHSDSEGKFNFSISLLTDNPSKHDLVRLSICRKENFAPTSITSNKIFLNCQGVLSYFYIVEGMKNLEINLGSIRELNFNSGSAISTGCVLNSGLKTCSVFFSDVLSGEIISQQFNKFENKTYEFSNNPIFYVYKYENLSYRIKNGTYTISGTLSDEKNAKMFIYQFDLGSVVITNPYPEKAEALIKSTNDACLINGEKAEIREVFNAYESKVYTLSKPPQTECKIEYNFIKVENVNIDVPIISFSVVSIALVSLTVIILRKYLKKRKTKNN